MAGVENAKSISETFLLEGFILVCSLSLIIIMLSGSNSFYMIFPLGLVLYESHVRLWLLKSLTIMKGRISCLIIFSRSLSVKWTWLGMYMLQRMVFVSSVIDIVIISMLEFLGISSKGNELLMSVHTPPLALRLSLPFFFGSFYIWWGFVIFKVCLLKTYCNWLV